MARLPVPTMQMREQCYAKDQVLPIYAQISGEVDQTAGMLDEEAKEKGYALMCVAEPQSDCRIKVIDEVSPCSV